MKKYKKIILLSWTILTIIILSGCTSQPQKNKSVANNIIKQKTNITNIIKKTKNEDKKNNKELNDILNKILKTK